MPTPEVVSPRSTVGGDRPARRPRSVAAGDRMGQLSRWSRGPGGSAAAGSASRASTTSCRSTSPRTPSTAPGSNSRGTWSRTMRARVAMACRLDWAFGGESRAADRAGRRLADVHAGRAGRRTADARDVGWHPWFVKPDEVDLRFERMYLRDDDYITDGRTVSPPPAATVGRLLRRARWPHHGCGSVESRCRSRATATTGSSTTCRRTRRASNRSPRCPMRSTWRRHGPGTRPRTAPHDDHHLGPSGVTPRLVLRCVRPRPVRGGLESHPDCECREEGRLSTLSRQSAGPPLALRELFDPPRQQMRRFGHPRDASESNGSGSKTASAR